MNLDLSAIVKTLGPSQRSALEDMTPGLLRISGGLGSGKTSIGALKTVVMSSANAGYNGAIWAKSYGQLKANCIDPISRFLPPQAMRIRDPSGERYFRWNGGKVFLCQADRAEFRDGINVGWFWSDETRHYKREAVQIMLSRLRQKAPHAQGWMTTTPGGHLLEFCGDDKARTIRLATSDNAPNLDPGYIERLKKSYSPRMWDAYLKGVDVSLEGAVYDQLPGSIWESPWALDYDVKPKRHTILFVDPGFRRSAWALAQETSPGSMQWVACHEWIGESESDWAMVKRVNATLDRNGWGVDEIWIDPAADGTQTAIALDTLALVRAIRVRRRNDRDVEKKIFFVRPPFNSIEYGVDKLRVLLGDPSEDVPIRLFFARRLRQIEDGKEFGLVKSLMSLRYPDSKGGRGLSLSPEDDPLHSHFCAATRYFAVGRWLKSGLRDLDPRIGSAQGFAAV